ncbi:MAG: DNA polymerase I, partial [Clostridia bacterium]|nr:DNA polymerase I [Clostridia bacterium]
EESARLSKILATINCEVPLEVTTADFTYQYPFSLAVKQSFIENGFKSIYKRDDLFDETTAVETSADTTNDEITEVVVTTVEQIETALSSATAFSYIETEEIRISTDGKTEYKIPLAQTLLDQAVNYSSLINALKPYFESDKVLKIVYDGKKLMRSLDTYSVALANYDDLRLRQYLVDMRIKSESVIDYVAECGLNATYPASMLIKRAKILAEQTQNDKLTDLYKIELSLQKTLYRMEKRGVKIDTKLLGELSVEYEKRIAELDEKICSLAGKKFNINSPKQLAEVLFEDLAITYPKKNTTKYSTSAEILESIQTAHEIIPLVMKYRFVTKLNGTYIEGMRKLLSSDIIHTEYNQTLTTTGRLSSSEPNLQNIPVREEEGKRLRGLFVARDGFTLVSADYSQIELRLLAHFSQDQIMLEQYRSGADIHARTASEIFGVPIENVTAKMRREAKTINFGIIYGMSDFGLSQSLKCSVSTAKQYMKKYFERFPAIKPYFTAVVDEAKKNGYTTTLLGRKRYIPELNSANAIRRSFGERAAMNMPLQGSAADIIKLAMVEVDKRLENMKSKLILQIHDELIIEASDDELNEVKTLLVECMENAVKLTVPLTVDVSSGKSWLDC